MPSLISSSYKLTANTRVTVSVPASQRMPVIPQVCFQLFLSYSSASSIPEEIVSQQNNNTFRYKPVYPSLFAQRGNFSQVFPIKSTIQLKYSHAICPKPGFSPPILIGKIQARHSLTFKKTLTLNKGRGAIFFPSLQLLVNRS
ncbi:hypothetical protein AVEN_123460-1 [Araneus ventricosus]|uniref:Uncharacterized protein n=1 Tax=Araneus ventricosus TaxID=182803 RepID=A0A4Y2MAY6_ARAVE|nr:hypothetical protein AVEN_123460-1 [Araneus ventricosus]